MTTNNDCFNLLYGRSCQNEAYEFYPDIPREIIKVPPYGIKYVALDYPFFAYNSVTYKITPVSLFDPKVSIFYKDVSKGHHSEIEADLIASKKDFISTYVMEDVMPESDIYALAMIYNTSPYPTDFVISAEYEAYEGPDGPIRPTASSKPSIENGDGTSWKKEFIIAASLAIAFGAIMFGLALALVVILVIRKRNNVGAPLSKSNLNDSIL